MQSLFNALGFYEMDEIVYNFGELSITSFYHNNKLCYQEIDTKGHHTFNSLKIDGPSLFTPESLRAFADYLEGCLEDDAPDCKNCGTVCGGYDVDSCQDFPEAPF
jgi:hypothetical protein